MILHADLDAFHASDEQVLTVDTTRNDRASKFACHSVLLGRIS